MISGWFKGVKKEDVERRKEIIRNSKNVLDILKEILYNKLKEVEKVSPSDYDIPSWAFKQADNNGQIRILKEVIQYLEVDDPHQ